MGGSSRKVRSEATDVWEDDIHWDADYTSEEYDVQEAGQLDGELIIPPLQTLTQKLDLERLVTKVSSDWTKPKQWKKEEHSKEEDCSQTMGTYSSDQSSRLGVSFEQEIFIYSRKQEQTRNWGPIHSGDFPMSLDLAVGESALNTTNGDAGLLTLIHNELRRKCKDYRASQIGDGQPGGSLVVRCASFKAAFGAVWKLSPIEETLHGGYPWDIQVFPLEGCPWDACNKIRQELETKLKSSFGTYTFKNVLQHCKLYFSLSLKIINLNEWLVKRLGSFLPFEGVHAASCDGWIAKGLNRANLPVGQCFGAFEQIDALVNTVLPQRIPKQARQPCVQTGAVCKKRCIVCFDDFDATNPSVTFSECGHQACGECVRHYFLSDSSFRCPGHLCIVRLNLLDAASCLFNDSSEREHVYCESSSLGQDWAKLLHFRRQQYLPKSLSNSLNTSEEAKFCSNSDCQCLTLPPRSSADTDSTCKMERDLQKDGASLPLGFSMNCCKCGAASCSSCNSNRAHPGMSCKEYVAVRSAITKIGEEKESMRWFANNSKPCPKCSRPIQRSGGCNHIWCEGCNYYFCWFCGGLGNKCWAYQCNNEETSLWANQIVANKEAAECGVSKECRLLDKVSYYEAALAKLDRTMVDGDDSARRTMERHLCQVLLWCFTYEMHALVTQNTGATIASEYEYARDRVELVRHVLKMKDVASTMEGMTVLDLITNGAVRDANAKRKKKIRTAKQKTTYSTHEVDCFRKCIAETTLFELCQQSESQIRVSAAKSIENAIHLLKERVADSKIRRQRKDKYRQPEANGTATTNNRTNEWVKERSKGPWNTGFVRKNDKNGSPRLVRWKGKTAAKELNRRLREKYQLEFS